MHTLKSYFKNPAQVRKALSALVSCILVGVASHVLPHAVGEWVNLAQPLLVAYGVWQVPENAKPAPAEGALPSTPPAA